MNPEHAYFVTLINAMVVGLFAEKKLQLAMYKVLDAPGNL